jgi:hypothetical protein
MGAWNVFVTYHLFHILIKKYLAYRVKVGLKNIFTNKLKPTCYLFLLN